MGDYAIYRWPRGTPLFCLIGLYALGFLLAAQPEISKPLAGKVGVAAYFFVVTLFCAYLYSFRVVLGAASIRTGAIFLKEMEFADVVRARYVQGDDCGQIILWDSNGTRMRISETIHNFRSCASAIDSRLPAHLSIYRGGRTMPRDVLSGSGLI